MSHPGIFHDMHLLLHSDDKIVQIAAGGTTSDDKTVQIATGVLSVFFTICTYYYTLTIKRCKSQPVCCRFFFTMPRNYTTLTIKYFIEVVAHLLHIPQSCTNSNPNKNAPAC